MSASPLLVRAVARERLAGRLFASAKPMAAVPGLAQLWTGAGGRQRPALFAMACQSLRLNGSVLDDLRLLELLIDDEARNAFCAAVGGACFAASLPAILPQIAVERLTTKLTPAGVRFVLGKRAGAARLPDTVAIDGEAVRQAGELGLRCWLRMHHAVAGAWLDTLVPRAADVLPFPVRPAGLASLAGELWVDWPSPGGRS